MITVRSDGVAVRGVVDAQRVPSPWAQELWVVLAEIDHTGHPYVTWLWNPSTQGLSHGHYFATLADARADFTDRVADYQHFTHDIRQEE